MGKPPKIKKMLRSRCNCVPASEIGPWNLLHNDGLNQVSGPVHIDTPADRQRVRKNLQRYDFKDCGK
jgi:hypothetical protein